MAKKKIGKKKKKNMMPLILGGLALWFFMSQKSEGAVTATSTANSGGNIKIAPPENIKDKHRKMKGEYKNE